MGFNSGFKRLIGFVRLALSCCFADIMPNQGVVYRHLPALLAVVAGHSVVSFFTRGSDPAATWQHSGLVFSWGTLFISGPGYLLFRSLQLFSPVCRWIQKYDISDLVGQITLLRTRVLWPFLLMAATLSSLALNNRLLSTVLTAVWILVCNGESNSHP